jgi:hypothetical protein
MAKRRTRKANKVVNKPVAPVVVQETVAIREYDNFEKSVIALATFFENVAKYFSEVATKKVV